MVRTAPKQAWVRMLGDTVLVMGVVGWPGEPPGHGIRVAFWPTDLNVRQPPHTRPKRDIFDRIFPTLNLKLEGQAVGAADRRAPLLPRKTLPCIHAPCMR